MALPALAPLLGGIAKGATAAGARSMASGAVRSAAGGKIKSGITKSVKGGGKKGGDLKISGKNTINPESIIPSPGGALVPMSSPKGGSLSTTVTPKSRQSSSIISTPTSKNDSAIQILQQVKSTTDQILEVEVRDLGSQKEEVKNTKEQIRDEQKLLEQEKKQEEQDKQEQSKTKKRKKSNPIVSAAKKTVGGIWSFLSGLLGEFILYHAATPIEDDVTHLRWSMVVSENIESDDMGKTILAAMSEGVLDDIPIWEEKAYQPNPVLCDGDGPIAKNRKWFEQF